VLTVIVKILTITGRFICGANSYCDNNRRHMCSVSSYCNNIDNNKEIYMQC
jgi:hypothetical protein